MAMNDEDELTLTNILNEAKQTKKDLQEFTKSSDDRIEEITDLIVQINDLRKENENYPDLLNELMKYKSALLQIKSEIESEKKSMTSEISKMDQIISAVEKAIKWNTGDIF